MNRALAWLRVNLSYLTTPRDRLRLRHTRLDGRDFVVAANEDLGRQMVYRGEYERHESRFFQEHLRPDDLCLDVGANIGYYTVLMAAAARHGTVHAFEPEPFSRALLHVNVLLNGLRNVVVNGAAVGRARGEAPFVVASDRAFSGFADTKRRAVEEVLTVPVTTLDEYVDTCRVPRVDVLKVDVEGAEAEILEGARHLLSDGARRPRVVMLELFDTNQRAFSTSIDAIVERMRGAGYTPFVVHDGRCTAFTKAHHNRHVNVFFSPDARGTRHPGGGE